MSPDYTRRQLNHNLMYTMDHTFGYHSKKFICACVKLSAHAHGTEIRGGNQDAQGNGQFTTDSQGCKWTSGGDPRTGKFHQTWVTMGDTTCNVKGV